MRSVVSSRWRTRYRKGRPNLPITTRSQVLFLPGVYTVYRPPLSYSFVLSGWHQSWYDFIDQIADVCKKNPSFALKGGRFVSISNLQELNGLPLRAGVQLLTSLVKMEIDPKTMAMQAAELKRLYTVCCFVCRSQAKVAFAATLAKLCTHQDYTQGKFGKGYDFEALYEFYVDKFDWFDEDFMNANRHWVKMKGAQGRVDNAWNISNPQLETILNSKIRSWEKAEERKDKFKVYTIHTDVSEADDPEAAPLLRKTRVACGDVRHLTGPVFSSCAQLFSNQSLSTSSRLIYPIKFPRLTFRVSMAHGLRGCQSLRTSVPQRNIHSLCFRGTMWPGWSMK